MGIVTKKGKEETAQDQYVHLVFRHYINKFELAFGDLDDFFNEACAYLCFYVLNSKK